MAPLITENIEQIISACERHKVKYLYVFGSAARGTDFSTNSDVDFLYAFDKERIQLDDYADNYFDFRFIYLIEVLIYCRKNQSLILSC